MLKSPHQDMFINPRKRTIINLDAQLSLPKCNHHFPYIIIISLPPQFNHFNVCNEQFAIEPKEQPISTEKNMCLGRYTNSKEMLSKIVYAKKKTKDNRILFENKFTKDKTVFPDNRPSSVFIYTLKDKNDTTLLFESRFESGNLLAAFRVEVNSYQLLLQNDTNTTGYNKWFFFRVSNMRKGQRYSLAIMNNQRQNKQYMKGIKIFTYSNRKNHNEKIGWHHSGDDIALYPNHLYQFNKNKKTRLYTLAFSFVCKYDGDTMYFANCIPYLYNKLMTELQYYNSNNTTRFPFYKQNTLCQSLGGLDIDYFTISTTGDAASSNNKSKPINTKQREGIVFFARQHPSETVGSWVIQGAIHLLMGNSDEAKYLRNNFDILIVPMVNIDGVIAGNTRTSLFGCDLNRKWKRPKKSKYPEIFYIKELIRQFTITHKVMCLVDFHGHHGAFNSFFYCNYNENDINQARAFPYACAKSSGMINFDQCSFSMMRYKYGAGRINLYREFGIENACTLETSCFGYDQGKYAYQYINEENLQEIGRDVCLGIVAYHYYKNTTAVAIPVVLKGRIGGVVNELNEGKMKIKEEDFKDDIGSDSDDDANDGIAIEEDDDDNDNGENDHEAEGEGDEEDKNAINKEDDEDNDKEKEKRHRYHCRNNVSNFIDGDEKNTKTNEDIILKKCSLKKLPKIKKLKIRISSNNPLNTDTNDNNSSTHHHDTDNKYCLTTNKKSNLSEINHPIILSPRETIVVKDIISLPYIDLDATALSFPQKNLTEKAVCETQGKIIKLKEHKNSCLGNILATTTNLKVSTKLRPLIIKHKVSLNMGNVSPKKFYATRDGNTQTEEVFFDMKRVLMMGTYKIIGYDEEKEKAYRKRRGVNCLTMFCLKDDVDHKESISTQTD